MDQNKQLNGQGRIFAGKQKLKQHLLSDMVT